MNKLSKTTRRLLIMLFAVLLMFSAAQLTMMLEEYRQGQESYGTLEQYVSTPVEGPTIFHPERGEDTDGTADEEGDTVWPEVDFDRLREINADIIGWIYIEGTNINYPVVKSSDNSYYLSHLFDKTRNASGCIFLDMNCPGDLSGQHNIIHGHHMKDKSMFAGLVGYKEQKFYDEHPRALFLTPGGKYVIHLFSGYVTDNWSSAWITSFDDKDYAAWLREIQEKSAFDPVVIPGAGDKVMTLSTCTYEFDDAKFVVHGYMEAVPEK